MVTYTWNNIVKYFETISNEHDFIKGFGSGFSDDVEINLEKNENYQFLGIIPRQVAPKEQTNEITVGMFVCDLVKTDQRNEAEVLSDTLQTFNDILKIFRNEDLNISLKGEPTIEPFKEKYSDNVAGWMGDIVLEVNYASNYCDIPSGVFGTGGTEGGEPQPGSDFITCETLSDCERIVSIVAELNDHESRITALEQGGSGLTCEDVANCQIVLDILGVLAVYDSRISDNEAAIQSLNSTITDVAINLQGQIDTKLNISSYLGYPSYFEHASFGPLDNTTYYFGGSVANVATTTEGIRRKPITVSGTITTVSLAFACNVGASSEAANLYIRINGTTDHLVSNAVTYNAAVGVYLFTGLSIPVVAGGYYEFKLVTPVYANNPAALREWGEAVIY